MDSRDIQLALLQDLIAAPGSKDGWSAFLLRLCDALNGSAASFISHDFRSAESGISLTARTDPEALAAYHAHWHRFDPWATSPAFKTCAPGAVVPGEALIRHNEIRKTPFFNDFGRQFGIVHCLAGVIEVSPQRLSCLSVDGTANRGEFSAEEGALLRSLMSPLQRALGLHRRLGGLELTSLRAGAVMDLLGYGVLYVARNGSISFTNRLADEILRARDGLSYEHGELRGSTVGDTARLRLALRTAHDAGEAAGAAGGRLLLPRPSGRRPLMLLVAPLPAGRAELTAEGAMTVIFVTDPERSELPDVDTIRRMFGLTPAEARLARHLAAGLSLEQAARESCVRLETVRTRLKMVFQKTDTHRQADLVRLVLSAASNWQTE